jgi:hypothetical protein
MRGPLIGRKDFQTSIGQGEQAQGGSKGCTKEGDEYLIFGGRKRKEKEMMEKILMLMWEKVLFMKRKICANKSMEGSCV